MCAGAVAFILALAASAAPAQVTIDSAARALIVSIVCGVMCWASIERTVATTAQSLDAAIIRLTQAANGDLEGPIPDDVRDNVPELAGAMEGLFRQLHLNLESVQRLAMFDPVTALANRTNFRRAAERALSELQTEEPAVLYFIDLDRFKLVNDTLGHATGDALLGMVANRLRAVANRFAAATGSGTPLVGRLAGDEFTMLFPGIRDPKDADRIGRGIMFALSETFDLADQEICIGASVGIAIRPQHGVTLHDMMRSADAAMYRAKGLGRGRVELFSEELAAEIAERVQLEHDLRDAVEKEQFALVFQPQISAVDGRITAAEALLRWKHPSGLKMPGAFLQRAEETGLIVEIGEWVLQSAAQTIARWGRLGVEQRLAVNISKRQIDHAHFFRRLREAMVAANAPANLLELEITETLAMDCSKEVLEAISLLRADGATVSIDGFGTGYSNLSRLRGLPVDRIKLDRSVTQHVAHHSDARAITQALIGLVHGLGCEVVAEGVEHDDQAAVLRVLGCDALQGYAVAQPMAEDEFLAWSQKVEPRFSASIAG